MGVGTIKVIGLQMTVARRDRPLKEQGVLALEAAANSIHNKMDNGHTMEKTEVSKSRGPQCMATLCSLTACLKLKFWTLSTTSIGTMKLNSFRADT
jgi:hypothetical protein